MSFVSGCWKRWSAKGVQSLFSCLVTFWSLFLTRLSLCQSLLFSRLLLLDSFCWTPAAGWLYRIISSDFGCNGTWKHTHRELYVGKEPDDNHEFNQDFGKGGLSSRGTATMTETATIAKTTKTAKTVTVACSSGVL